LDRLEEPMGVDLVGVEPGIAERRQRRTRVVRRDQDVDVAARARPAERRRREPADHDVRDLVTIEHLHDLGEDRVERRQIAVVEAGVAGGTRRGHEGQGSIFHATTAKTRGPDGAGDLPIALDRTRGVCRNVPGTTAWSHAFPRAWRLARTLLPEK